MQCQIKEWRFHKKNTWIEQHKSAEGIQTASMSVFGIAVAVMVVILKKLFYKKILLVEVGLEKYMFG